MIVLPPARPGWMKGPNSGVIAVAAGAFKSTAARALGTGIVEYFVDPVAPGPTQVRDQQTATGPTTADDSVVIPLDTVLAVTGTAYKVHVGYRVIDGGGGPDPHLAIVRGDGKVFETDWNLTSQPGVQGESLYVSPIDRYSMMEPDGFNVTDNTTAGAGFGFTGPVIKSGPGETLKLRAYFKDASAGASTSWIVIDTIWLFPMSGFFSNPWNAARQEVHDPPYTDADDGWVYPGFGGTGSPFGWNGAFPASDAGQQVADSNGVSTPPDPNVQQGVPPDNHFPVFDSTGLGLNTSPQNLWLTARVTDPTKGGGKIRVVTFPSGGTQWVVSSFEYDVPGDGNVYVVRLQNDVYPAAASGDSFGWQMWTPDPTQNLRVDLMYANAADPPKLVVFGGDGFRLGD